MRFLTEFFSRRKPEGIGKEAIEVKKPFKFFDKADEELDELQQTSTLKDVGWLVGFASKKTVTTIEKEERSGRLVTFEIHHEGDEPKPYQSSPIKGSLTENLANLVMYATLPNSIHKWASAPTPESKKIGYKHWINTAKFNEEGRYKSLQDYASQNKQSALPVKEEDLQKVIFEIKLWET